MTVRGEIYVLTSNWRNCAQRFFLTDSEYTFGSFVQLSTLQRADCHNTSECRATGRTAM